MSRRRRCYIYMLFFLLFVCIFLKRTTTITVIITQELQHLMRLCSIYCYYFYYSYYYTRERDNILMCQLKNERREYKKKKKNRLEMAFIKRGNCFQPFDFSFFKAPRARDRAKADRKDLHMQNNYKRFFLKRKKEQRTHPHCRIQSHQKRIKNGYVERNIKKNAM